MGGPPKLGPTNATVLFDLCGFPEAGVLALNPKLPHYPCNHYRGNSPNHGAVWVSDYVTAPKIPTCDPHLRELPKPLKNHSGYLGGLALTETLVSHPYFKLGTPVVPFSPVWGLSLLEQHIRKGALYYEGVTGEPSK